MKNPITIEVSVPLSEVLKPVQPPAAMVERIRAAITAKRTGIAVHEGPPTGPTCPRCQYDWLLCPCPGEVLLKGNKT